MKNQKNRRTETVDQAKHENICVGIDTHLSPYAVCRKTGGKTPQPGKVIRGYANLLGYMREQLKQAKEVYACYEAGPFGYRLYYDLLKLGVHAVVVAPQKWDERNKRVKTDKKDAHQMVQRLYRYFLNADEDAFTVIRVPNKQEQRLRSEHRLRDQLMRHRKSLASQGRSLLRFNGYFNGGEILCSYWRMLQYIKETD